jgi:dTMP kinase
VAGCFITLEGIEGSGKTSQQLRLVERLRTRDVAVLALREPGGTPLAEEVRALLLARRGPDGRESRVAPWSEAFLMLAARAQLVSEVVRPALAAGTWVVCDRFTDSTVAYQGGGRGLDRAMLARLNQAATGGLAPDLTLLFDLPVGEALARLERNRPDPEITRFDQESRAFHERVRAAFLELARGEPARFAVVDAARGLEAVAEDAWARVAPLVEGRG